MSRRTLVLSFATALVLVACTGEALAANSWFVRAAAPSGGDGSRARPFGTLQDAERASAAGDRIVVLAAPADTPPLDGGITLKPRQRLRGDGPPVVALDKAGHTRLHTRLRKLHRSGHRKLPRRLGARRTRAHRALHRRLRAVHAAPHATAGPALPVITNTRPERQDGDAVRVGDGAIVENLVIVDPLRAGVYGIDLSTARVQGNDISGHNASCTPGFLIQPFQAPTSVPGVHVPISNGLSNGFAAIMFDSTSSKTAVRIDRNYVHDATCGDGIDVRVHGTATTDAHVTANRVARIIEGEQFDSVLAFGFQTLGHGKLTADLDDNRADDIGHGPPTPEGDDSEGLFANLDDDGEMDIAVNDFHYTNPRGVGGFSANGMELVITGGKPKADVVVRNSSFSGSPGDVIEEAILGANASMSLVLDNVDVSRSTGLGNSQVIPFNNGDCVLAGSGDANNKLSLRILDSRLTGCVNNGLTLLSANTGTTMDVAVERSVITGHRGANVYLRDTAELKRFDLKIQESALCNSQSTNVELRNDSGAAPQGTIDLGGGALGSTGNNDLSGGNLQAVIQNVDVSAKHNWWGSPDGPGPGRTAALGGKLERDPVLGAVPRLHC